MPGHLNVILFVTMFIKYNFATLCNTTRRLTSQISDFVYKLKPPLYASRSIYFIPQVILFSSHRGVSTLLYCCQFYFWCRHIYVPGICNWSDLQGITQVCARRISFSMFIGYITPAMFMLLQTNLFTWILNGWIVK